MFVFFFKLLLIFLTIVFMFASVGIFITISQQLEDNNNLKEFDLYKFSYFYFILSILTWNAYLNI